MNHLLEESKDEMDDESYQKAIRAAWEEHDSKVESLQAEQQVSCVVLASIYLLIADVQSWRQSKRFQLTYDLNTHNYCFTPFAVDRD